MARNNQGTNAKNLDYKSPGAALSGYGITPDNLYPKLSALYKDRATVDGGSKSIWDAMLKNTAKALARSPDSAAVQEFNTFLKTGKIPANPSRQFQRMAAESLDYGLRETGRAQQNKPTSIWTSILTDVLPAIALGAIPGVGPALATAYGGIKGGVEGGVLGGLTGALGGYTGGQFGNSLGSVVRSTGGVAASLANPGTFGLNLVDKFNPFSAGGMLNNPGAGNAFSGANGALNAGNSAANALSRTGGQALAAGNLIDGATGQVISNATRPASSLGSVLNTIGTIGSIAAPIIGGIQAGNAAEKAANTQLAYGNAAIAENRRQYDQSREDLAPWLATGEAALNNLSGQLGLNGGNGALMKDFSLKDFQADPSYAFRRQEGLKGVNNSAAVRGMQLSGATLKALNRYNSDLASQEYGNAFNRDAANKNRKFNFLSGVAGTGQAAANTGAALGAQSSSNTQNTLTGMGNAQAAGYVGANNNLVGGINDAFQAYQQQQLLNRLFPQYSSTGNSSSSNVKVPIV
jgi:hypothetical protein